MATTLHRAFSRHFSTGSVPMAPLTSSVSERKEALLEHSIHPGQQFSYTNGKNATDSAMIIDAMDLLHTRQFLASASSQATAILPILPPASENRVSQPMDLGIGKHRIPSPKRATCLFISILWKKRRLLQTHSVFHPAYSRKERSEQTAQGHSHLCQRDRMGLSFCCWR